MRLQNIKPPLTRWLFFACNEEVEFIFEERAIDQALSDLEILGFCDQDPILIEDLVNKGYVTVGLRHFEPIPWLILVASIRPEGRRRLININYDERHKPESERLTKHNSYRFDMANKIYMGYLVFTAKKIQEEINEGRHVRVARLSASNASHMNVGDELSRLYPDFFGPNSEHVYG